MRNRVKETRIESSMVSAARWVVEMLTGGAAEWAG